MVKKLSVTEMSGKTILLNIIKDIFKNTSIKTKKYSTRE